MLRRVQMHRRLSGRPVPKELPQLPVESLEGRQLLSFAASLSGPIQAVEEANYTRTFIQPGAKRPAQRHSSSAPESPEHVLSRLRRQIRNPQRIATKTLNWRRAMPLTPT